MPPGEFCDEPVEFGRAPGITAEVETRLDAPVRGQVRTLQPGDLVVEELPALEHGESQCPPRRAKGQTGEGPAGAHRAADQVVRLGDLQGEFRAALDAQGIGSALGEQVEVPVGQRFGPVGRAVEIAELHAPRAREGERAVERQMLLAPDQADRGEAEDPAGGGRGPDVVGVAPAERDQRVVPLRPGFGEVVLELAPLVARQLGMDQVVAFEEQLDPAEPFVVDLGDGGGQPEVHPASLW